MLWLYLLFALAAGALIPAQAGINSQLGRWVGHPVAAALVSFVVGTVALLAYCLALRLPPPAWGALSQAPWWAWTGGLLGAFFVAVAAAFAPKMGAATFISVTIAAQMISSIVLDHFGLAGFDLRPANVWRLVGALLLVAGVVLIRKF